jgi:hypothetical protein
LTLSACAHHPLGEFSGLLQRGQQDCQQQRDDSYNNQKFYQRKTAFLRTTFILPVK